MTDLTALIGRLEAAREGSRELDAEIAAAICDVDAWPEKDGRIWLPGAGSVSSMSFDAAPYTTSLDAAFSLFDSTDNLTIFQAKERWAISRDLKYLADAATLPLALSAAALREKG